MFLGTISMLSFVAIGILYVDIGLRGSFDRISNLRVFFDQQVLHFTFSSSLFDVVVLTFLRMLLLGLQSLLVQKFNTTLVLVQVPAAPVLQASATGQTVSASWTAVPGATSYRVEAGVTPSLMLAGYEIGPLTSFSIQAPQGSYYLRVLARNGNGVSAPSNCNASKTVRPTGPR